MLRGRDVGASTVGNCLHRALAAISAGPRGLFISLRLSLGSISSLPLQLVVPKVVPKSSLYQGCRFVLKVVFFFHFFIVNVIIEG